jgi:hypothetical protein
MRESDRGEGWPEKKRIWGRDLTGKTFVRLLVLKKLGLNDGGRRLWLCLCDCGNETQVVTSHLVQGQVVSCGCIGRTRRIHDLAGQTFGKLIVCKPYEYRHGRIYWPCLCSCGNKKWVAADNLRRGLVISCGCMRGHSKKELLA